MSEPQIHYEIHGMQTGSWAVQKVCDDKVTAIETAKGLFRDLDLKAIKVLKVVFDTDDPIFKDKEVYFDGERVVPSKLGSVELIEPICHKPEDMYVPDARRAIFRLLQKPLAGWQKTPLELLYHQGNLQKLNDTGQILQGAVQKTAISQVQKTGQKVNERVLDLYSITNKILQDLKTTTKEQDIPDIEGDDLLAALAEAKKGENWRKIFMMSMARHFQDIKTLDEKFEKIITYLLQYDDPEILEMLDRYLGDFLSSPARLQALLGEEENLGDALVSLVDFIRGAKKTTLNMHKSTQRINMLLRDKKLPEVRQALTIRFRDTLMGNKSFVKNDAVKSMSYHRLLMARMHIADGEHIGGQDAVEALISRCERMTGSTTISAFLEGLDQPLDRVDRLLQVNEGVIGPVNKRTIANYILPVLESTSNVISILKQREAGTATIARLKNIQAATKKSGFQNFYSDKILESLDRIGMRVLTEKKVLENLARDSKDNIQLGLNLLQLISAEKLTEPTALNAVRDYAKKTIVSAEFMRTLEQKTTSDSAQQAEFFRQFYKLLEKTGIR